jgi:hypothetical protein
MCLVSRVKARLLALLLVLVAMLGQQRALRPVVQRHAPVARLVSERTELIQSTAVRSEPASRLSSSPVLARPPAPPVALPAARAWSLLPPRHALTASRLPSDVTAHFHSKRRIPRMNSEEPPRA